MRRGSGLHLLLSELELRLTLDKLSAVCRSRPGFFIVIGGMGDRPKSRTDSYWLQLFGDSA